MRWVKRIAIGIAAIAVAGAVFFFGFVPQIADKSMNPVIPHDPYPVSARAEALHKALVVGDWHADSLLFGRNLLKRGTRGQVDVPRLIDGNVAVQVFTAVTKSPRGLNYDQNDANAPDDITLVAFGSLWPVKTWTSIYERAVYQAGQLHNFAARSDGKLRVLTSRADLDTLLADRAAGQTVVGGVLGIEGGHPLEGKIDNLAPLWDAGYRLIGLTHFFDNELGGSLHGAGNHGLTEFGKQVVREAAAKGWIIDLAHASEQMALDTLAMTDIPLIVSHTGLRSVCDVKRNFPDSLMQQIAATGGVIGIGYWGDVTCDPSPSGVAKVIKAAIAVVGADHVSLGSDYDGTVETAFDTSELAVITSELMALGVPDDQIAAVMGGNMMRVLRERLQ